MWETKYPYYILAGLHFLISVVSDCPVGIFPLRVYFLREFRKRQIAETLFVHGIGSIRRSKERRTLFGDVGGGIVEHPDVRAILKLEYTG